MGGGGSNKIDETPEQRELARIAAEQYQYYESQLMPVRNEYIDEMLDGNNTQNYERLAGGSEY